MRSSEKYVERIVDSIEAFRKSAARNEKIAEAMRSQQEDSRTELDLVKQRQQRYVDDCKFLKKQARTTNTIDQ